MRRAGLNELGVMSNQHHKKKHKHVSKKGTLYQSKQALRRKGVHERDEAVSRVHPRNKRINKRSPLEQQVANYSYLVLFSFFFLSYIYVSFKTRVIRRRLNPNDNFRRADRSVFVVKTRCCPALKYYSGWVSLMSMVLTLLFFIFQATAEIDLCWDDSKDIYRGIEKRHASQRAYLDFLRKSVYGFSFLLAIQLSFWDTTPRKEENDGGEDGNNQNDDDES